ncbi:MAG: O-antigen ligase family protein [Candidatus Omnitrophota bacterium]
MKILEWFLIFLVIFSPLFHGSVEQIPLFVIEAISLCAFLLLIINTKVSNRELAYPPGLTFVAFSLLIILFQVLSVPNFVLKIISPHTYLFRQQYSFDFSNFGFSQLSFYSLATIEEFIKLVSFLFVFICALNIFEKKEQFERITVILIFLGLLLSFYGVVTKYFILQKQITRSFSTFGNRNHFAAYMIMIAPLSVAYALYCKNKNKKIIFGFIAAIICSAVFLSLSRGGSISLVISLAFLSYLVAKTKAHGKQYWIIAAVVIFAFVLVSLSGLGPIQHRMSIIKEGLAGRGFVVSDSLSILKNFPLFGIGLGNFKYVFTLYQKSRQTAVYYDYLHNDYLQFLIETGLICAVSFLIFFFNLFRSIIIGLNKRHDQFAKSVVMGGICGLLGVIIHSFVDFNFHIPAVSLLFWLLLGLIYKCLSTHFYSPEKTENE